MVKVKKKDGKEGEAWYEVFLIHPITKATVLESDGFTTLDDVAQFVSDIGSAVTDSFLVPEDIKEGLVVE